MADFDKYILNGQTLLVKDTQAREDIVNIESDITDIGSDITDIKADIVDIKADIVDIKDALVTIRGNISDLADRVTAIEKVVFPEEVIENAE